MFKGNRAALILTIAAIPVALIIAATAIGSRDPGDPTALRLRALAYISVSLLFLWLAVRQFMAGKKLLCLLSIVVACLLFADPLRKLMQQGLLGGLPSLSP